MIENESVASDCPLRHTARIALALSNLCPYQHMHAKCPASLMREPQILPGRVVEDVLRTAAEWGWGETGTLAWHMYNEPTVDPRLLHFCWMAKAMMPNIRIHIWTNGWYLDHGLATELSQVGISKLVVSAYSDREAARLEPLRRSLRDYPTHVKVLHRPLDDRLTPMDEMREARCHAPLYDLTIYPSGHLGMCCHDWHQKQSFGDLTQRPFADVMTEAFPEMAKLERQLEKVDRQLTLCRECRMRRPLYGYASGRKRGIDTPSADCDTGKEE